MLLFAAPICRPASAAITATGSFSGTAPGQDPIIGIDDIGRLTIDASDSLASDVAIIGDEVTGIGLVNVTGFNPSTGIASTWSTTSLMVANEGTGRLEIRDGAIVNVNFTANPGTGDLVIGDDADSLGTVIVHGLGSMLRLGDDATIGQIGTGILRIENEGYVIGTNEFGTDTFTVGVRGRLELDGGRLRTDVLTNHGVIIGGGRLDNDGPIVNSLTGHIEARAEDRLVVNALLNNQGDIAIVGGEIDFFDTVTSSHNGAEVTLRDGGRVTFPTIAFGYDSTAGTLASTAGVNDIYGTVRIVGANSKIVVAGESTAVFHDLVTNNGGLINVFPGSTAVYLDGLSTSGSGALMSIHLADPENEFDLGQVEVNGVAQLSGNLAISLASGFVPSAGDTFQILTADSVTGSLALTSAPALPGGMQWNLAVNPASVVLSVEATGDYNGDGFVDAADYVVWRKTFNQTGPGLAADGNGDRVVNDADYDFWQSRFGSVVGPGSGDSALVPEPANATLLLIGAAIALGRRRWPICTCQNSMGVLH
jgi:T5SS/PEP-CTERM-associated repeat protein